MTVNPHILIIGSGLAGLVNAIELAGKGHRVVVVEKEGFPRHKVCGEYVSNEVKPYLQRLGIFPNELQPKPIQRFELSSAGGQKAGCAMEMGGFGISRYAFDHFLYQRARELGVEFLLRTSVRAVSFEEDNFHVQLNDGAEIPPKVVIGAYGKRSLVDKNLDRDFIRQKTAYIAVKAHYRAGFPDDLVALHNFKGGYCGLSKVENDCVNLCYLTTSEILKSYASIDDLEKRHLTQNPFLKAFLTKAEPVFEKPLVISQVNFAPRQAVEKHVLMSGDAAGLIHPLCGNGMAMAIHSAKICSEKVDLFLNGKINRHQMETQYRQEWNGQFKTRLGFGKSAQWLFGRNWISQMAVGTARSFPAVLQQAVKLSHGKPVE